MYTKNSGLNTLVSKTTCILASLSHFLLSAATNGKDGNGLQLEKNGDRVNKKSQKNLQFIPAKIHWISSPWLLRNAMHVF